MRVLVMNRLETQYYSTCTDAKLLDFVGYRNELSMLSMTAGLLSYRLRNLRSVQYTIDDSMEYWHKFSLMYRAGKYLFICFGITHSHIFLFFQVKKTFSKRFCKELKR